MFKNFYRLFFLLQFATGVLVTRHCAAQSFDWAVGMGSTSIDDGRSIVVDTDGNSYITGRFSGTVDFDPGPGQMTLVSAGGSDVFILKLDATGSLVWAKRVGGASTDWGWSITLDASGNIYATGEFSLTADFDPGPGVFNLTVPGGSTSGADAFVLKLDTNGDFIWAVSMGGTELDRPSCIKSSGEHLYVTGIFRGVGDFDPGSAVVTLTSQGENDVFISKLDTAGNLIWAKSVGGDYYEAVSGMDLDAAENIYLTGKLQSTTSDFDPGPGVFNLSAVNFQNGEAYILKLDSSGNFGWVKKIDGGGSHGMGLAADTIGNIYVTGNFISTADFDPGTGTFNLTSAGTDDAFVLKLNTGGDFKWANSFGSVGGDMGSSIACDGAENIYLTGQFEGTPDFDPGVGAYTLISMGSYDSYIMRQDSAGSFVWARVMGGIGWERGFGVTVDKNGSVYSTGQVRSVTDMNTDTAALDTMYYAPASTGADIYVHKLKQCFPVAYNFAATTCDSFSIDGVAFYSASGMYIDTFTNVNGCDSVVTLDLTVTALDLSVNVVDSIATATAMAVTYQWVDCDNGNTAITGATDQSYVATQSGNYAVVINENGCSDTSVCVLLTVITSMHEVDRTHAGVIYPNPSSGKINVKPADATTRLLICNMTGQQVLSRVTQGKMIGIDISPLANGCYFLKELDKEGNVIDVHRVIKSN